jgi:putative inorganic carbon (hco3(-)) transporter
MRDILLVVVVFGSLPFILRRPFFGVLEWTWLGYFNPHRLAYSFAAHLPYSQAVGGVTLVAWLLNRNEPKRLPLCGATVIWIAFVLWMALTTVSALQADEASVQLIKVLKIQSFALLTIIMIHSWDRVRALVWCIVVSLGYYGLKGGAWVLLHGGAAGRVWGPEGTFIEGNNELALALLMITPLMYFLYATERGRWVRRALIGAMVLLGFSVAGSFSRGAMLAAAAMALFLIWRSGSRLRVAAAVFGVGLAIVSVMPQSWFDRLHTIQTYQDDGSALKRLNTWHFAWNFVQDNPVLGGGFEMFLSRDAYVRYAPRSDEGWIFQDAHSNYMKVLAEHGFPGLALFIAIFIASWLRAGRVIRWARNYAPDTPQGQAGLLARMLQASIVAYAVGGSFLGLCYFDLPYNIAGLCIALSTSVVGALARDAGSRATPHAADSSVASGNAAAKVSQ